MDGVAHALSDPIRRQVLLLLREGDRTAGAIASAFVVSRPAVSRHLRVLREAELVVGEQCGRERRYRLNLAPLGELESYLALLRQAPRWERRFDALSTEVQRRKRQRATRPQSTQYDEESA